jgi:hypothetical protein
MGERALAELFHWRRHRRAGPSIAKELLRGDTPDAFKKTAADNFIPRLTHEIDRMVSA